MDRRQCLHSHHRARPTEDKPGRERLDWEKEFNRQVSSWRSHIKDEIAHLKNWKTISTGYRGASTNSPPL